MADVDDVSAQLKTLAGLTQRSEPELLADAVQLGLRHLLREHMLGRYLRGESSRDETAEAVGLDWVELAERQHRAAQEDVAWGMRTPRS